MSGEPELHWVVEASLGLEACIAVHRRRNGIAAGGVRVRAYPDRAAQEADACALARAMAEKAALADVPCGGAKVVVRDHPGLERAAAMVWLGREVERRGGGLRVGPDFGFTTADHSALAGVTAFVVGGEGLAEATAAGVMAAMRAVVPHPWSGRTAGVLGLGAVGLPVARHLLAEGFTVQATDPDPGAATRGTAAGAALTDEAALARAPLDVLAPCALGGWLDETRAEAAQAAAIVGCANGILASPAAGDVLHRRGRLFVPDALSSAGALVFWAARALDGASLGEALQRVHAIEHRVRASLAEAAELDEPPHRTISARASRLMAAW